MSELQVGQINSTDGSTAITTGADGYVSFAKTQIGGRRNLIINGAMQVAQRGTSQSGVGNSATFIIDRFVMASGASSGTYTISQESDAPDGYAKSFKTLVTATGATGGANNAGFRYKFEGQDLQHLKYGSSGAVQLTLSFWFKTNQTGTYQVNMRNMDSGRIVGATYTVSAADTWEQKTITFPADTTGSFTNDNNESLRIDWWLHSGASYNTGTVPTTWEALNAADQAAGLTVDLADTINNYAQITGVQLEVGTVATPFEHRSYGEELALCQRYYQNSFDAGEAPTHNSSNAVYRAVQPFSGGNLAGVSVPFPVVMRATPTCTLWTAAPGANTSSGNISFYNGGWSSAATGLHETTSSKRISVLSSAAPSGTVLIQFNFEADAEL